MDIVIAVAAAAAVGVLSGMGIGGGTLLMIYLTVLAGVDQTAAQGINLIYFLPTSAASLVLHIKNRLVEKRAFVICSLSGTAAAILGSLAAGAVGSDVLRRIFGGALIAAGVWQIFVKKA